jgi:NIMA (never in mitosis gene a)-related kinase
VWSEQPYDSKSDIWSLGCVIYEMTALEVPFKAEDMEGLANCVLAGHFDPVPNIFSKELSILISNMLQLKPKNRPTC